MRWTHLLVWCTLCLSASTACIMSEKTSGGPPEVEMSELPAATALPTEDDAILERFANVSTSQSRTRVALTPHSHCAALSPRCCH